MEGCSVSRCAEGSLSMKSIHKLNRALLVASNARRCSVFASFSSINVGTSVSGGSASGGKLLLGGRIGHRVNAILQAKGSAMSIRESDRKVQSVAGQLPNAFIGSRGAFLKCSPDFLSGQQNWGRSFASQSRISATADVVNETVESDARDSEEPRETRRESTPLPRSLPSRPPKAVWVRPGVTPPPEPTFVEDRPRDQYSRSSRPFQGRGGPRVRNDRRYSRSDEFRQPQPKVENDKPTKAVVKKKVALWLGYVGTEYKGSMMQRNQEGPFVETHLEEAIFKAGGMKESNFGDFKKVGWNRSSRTDKGVHALASVVSFKMEVPAEVFVHDPEGLSLADKINAHLPPSIRVYGVQPVTKSFNAYHNCRARTYEYVLPAPVIGITDDMDDEAAQAALEKLRAIFAKYEGRQPFHNFTVRRLYRAGKKQGSKRRISRLTQDAETLLDLEGASDSEILEPLTAAEPRPGVSGADARSGSEVGTQNAVVGNQDSESGDQNSDMGGQESDVGVRDSDVGPSEADGARANGAHSDAPGASDDGDDNQWASAGDEMSPTDEFFMERRMTEELELEYDEEKEELEEDGHWIERRGPTAQWLLDTPPDDRIGPSHYRRILAATCTDLEPLGKSRVVRIQIEGESFMLHQIRKMVGAAVAIMRGDLPFEMLDPMLACHSRIIVPMAPAEGLFLSRTRFFPFRTSFNQSFTDDGPALELTPELEKAREEFRINQLLPAMAPLLDSEKEPWSTWVNRLNLIGPVPEEEVTQVMTSFETWRSSQPERGDATRERPPWFQNTKRPRPTTSQWGSRKGTQPSGGGRWVRS